MKKKKSKPQKLERLSWEEFWDRVGRATYERSKIRDEAQRIALQNAWDHKLG